MKKELEEIKDDESKSENKHDFYNFDLPSLPEITLTEKGLMFVDSEYNNTTIGHEIFFGCNFF
jgi:hypothetical protein